MQGLIIRRHDSLKQALRVDPIEKIGIAAKFAGNIDTSLLSEDAVDFNLTKHFEHIGDPLSCAGASPGYGLWLETKQVFFPKQAMNDGVLIRFKQFFIFERRR
jgi:hypothetical protein